jgi:hypothetical protein
VREEPKCPHCQVRYARFRFVGVDLQYGCGICGSWWSAPRKPMNEKAVDDEYERAEIKRKGGAS